jgi:predicted RNA methylase
MNPVNTELYETPREIASAVFRLLARSSLIGGRSVKVCDLGSGKGALAVPFQGWQNLQKIMLVEKAEDEAVRNALEDLQRSWSANFDAVEVIVEFGDYGDEEVIGKIKEFGANLFVMNPPFGNRM